MNFDISTFIKSLFEPLLREMVNYPDELKTFVKISDKMLIVEFECHPEDRKLLIGRKGTNINAIRVLMHCITIQQGYAVKVFVIET